MVYEYSTVHGRALPLTRGEARAPSEVGAEEEDKDDNGSATRLALSLSFRM
jgi:hypothetical protein